MMMMLVTANIFLSNSVALLLFLFCGYWINMADSFDHLSTTEENLIDHGASLKSSLFEDELRIVNSNNYQDYHHHHQPQPQPQSSSLSSSLVKRSHHHRSSDSSSYHSQQQQYGKRPYHRNSWQQQQQEGDFSNRQEHKNVMAHPNEPSLQLRSNSGGAGDPFMMNYNQKNSNNNNNNHNWPNIMKNITVTMGRNATFECVFPNLKDFRLVWFHKDHHALLAMHDSVISKNGRISVRSHANTTFYLTIHEVQESDRGFYMCQVNTIPMRTQIGYLEVNVPPSFIEKNTSSDVDVVENSSVNLQCQAVGRPEPEITWRREDGNVIIIDPKANDSLSTIKGQHLNMTNVTRHQMGAYLCIASNGIAPTISKRIFLGVSFAPSVWIRKEMVEAPLTSSIIIECHIESYPRANVYWHKNNQLNSIISFDNKKYSIFQNDSNIPHRFISRLKISRLQKSDFDKYICVAKNKMGSEKRTIRLLEIEVPNTSNIVKPKYNYEQVNNNNKKKLFHNHRNIITTPRIPNNPAGSLREKIKTIYDDENYPEEDEDEEEEVWQYETNYLTPELHSPGRKNEAINLFPCWCCWTFFSYDPLGSPQYPILILIDILLTIFVIL